jgi:uncharacterized protein (DUF4415 family)
MNPNFDDMKDDYSELFATQTPVRGKYYERAMREKHLVELDQDVLEAFPTKADVNAALRSLLEASKHVHLPH